MICKGISVGKINSLKLNSHAHIIAEIEVDKSVQVREGYQFAIVWLDSFGKRAIELIPADKGRYLTSSDSVKGITIDKRPIQQLDSLEYQIARDSILRLRRTRTKAWQNGQEELKMKEEEESSSTTSK